MAASSAECVERTLNFNIGILGHIDSGKTSLAKALSTVASTASFDKNPQSQERGITLDLGFSSFSLPIPSHLAGKGHDQVQFTLVDCPGHASLIRTIIGGAQIIDLMILVVDIVKGIQTQTAECLVIGEITCDHMIVVLNKTDLIEDSKRESVIAKVSKRVSKTLEATRFAGAQVVPLAAKPGGPEAPSTRGASGLDQLIKVLTSRVFVPKRSSSGPFVFSVDHCFPIRGQGTVMTGTVLRGSVAVNETIEIPLLKVTKKIKSMQMFHKPVQRALQGDRVGICVTQFDPRQVERCLVGSPGHLPTLIAAIVKVTKVSYHKLPCTTGAKFHVTIGHETVMGKVLFFGSQSPPKEEFDFETEYPFMEELLDTKLQAASKTCSPDSEDTVKGKESSPHQQFALLEFERPVTCLPDAIVIGSRLDTDVHSNVCRIAFHGVLIHPIVERDYATSVLPKIKIFKVKSRQGIIERLQDEKCVIGKNLFKKETNIQAFVGLRVTLSTGESGVIEGSFGTSGKFRVNIPDGLAAETQQLLSTYGKKKGRGKGGEKSEIEPVTISLVFHKYIFDSQKRIIQ